MTIFIRDQGLLDVQEIEAIIAGAPVDLVDFQQVAAAIPVDQRPIMRDWIDRFSLLALRSAVPADRQRFRQRAP